jgi:hypothetical protein
MISALTAVFGFACACPLLLITGINFRLTDLGNMVALCVVSGAAVLHGKLLRLAYLYGFLLLLTLGWILEEFLNAAYLPAERSAAMILVRWVMAIPTAYLMSILSRSNLTRYSLFSGMLFGFTTLFFLLLYDYGMFEVTGHPGFDRDPSEIYYANSEFRASGILGHPNPAAIACCFVLPVVIGMIDELRFPAWAAVPTALVVGAVFFVTETRSALIASFVLLGYWLAVTRPAVLFTFAVVAAALGLFLYVSVHGPSSSSESLSMIVNRFTDLTAAEDNAEGRAGTVMDSLALIASHPFGMGSAYEPALNALTGLNATHNGFLQLALLSGLPLALLVLIGLLKAGCGIFGSSRRVENWMATYTIIVSLFEAVYFIPFVPICVIWLIGCLLDSVRRPAPLLTRDKA